MAVHPIDYRYGSQEMRALFEETNLHAKKLAVEAALAEVLAEKGFIPREAAATITANARPEIVTVERVKQLEAETKHDIMALVKALTEVCGEAGKYVHLTATSYDIVDTALALVLRDALGLIVRKAKLLLGELLNLAEKHRSTVMVGRTHGQHAIPITLGFKLANYADKLGDDTRRLEEDKERYIVGKFSGAVGTYAAQQLLGLGDEIERGVMQKLGIPVAYISTQVVPREHLARIVADLAILAGTIEQMAKEVRNLQRTEIGEMGESFGKGQVGSSTMAQKRNPINAENICSNVRIIRSCVGPALENIALEHERDLTNSAAERSLLPTVFVLTDEILDRSRKVWAGIDISEERMRQNLDMSRGALMAERIITELVRHGMGRQDAHELLRESSNQALAQNTDIKSILIRSKAMNFLRTDELDGLLDYRSYIGLAEKKVDDVVARWRGLAKS